VGALAWALPLSGAHGWMMMAVGPLLSLLVRTTDPAAASGDVATAAVGALLAGATWSAFAGASTR
jgi:hypothetical protein